MGIQLSIAVIDIASVLLQYNRIKIYRSITGRAGAYTELTVAATRPVLLVGVENYAFTDDAGLDTYYYKSSYYSTESHAESLQSDPQQGDSDRALDLLTVEELRQNYLFGVDLTDEGGNAFPNSMLSYYIKSAVSWLEQKLDMPLRPTVILDECQDFNREDYDKYIFMETDYFPILSVEAIRLVLPGGQIVQTFDPLWINFEKDSGQIQIVPGTGTAGTILLGASGAWIPFIYGTNKFIPHAFHIDYTAGFEHGKLPPQLKDLIGKIASYGPLYLAGELLLGAGIVSSNVSIDGLSQSVGTMASPSGGAYNSRIKAYQEEVKEELPNLIRYYKGIRLRVV